MKKLLIVEDEENLRLLYREEFTEDGYDVDVAENAKKALSKFQRGNPDLVIVDIRLPGEDGLYVLSSIRELNRNIPVIICSAYGEYKQNPTSWGSDAYVVKSADLSELKTKVAELLKK